MCVLVVAPLEVKGAESMVCYMCPYVVNRKCGPRYVWILPPKFTHCTTTEAIC